MGLQDDIYTLEARFYSEQRDQDDGHKLAKAVAEMIGRKSSKRLIGGYFDDLQQVLNELGRYDELVRIAGGVDPESLSAWDCQDVVELWLDKQS